MGWSIETIRSIHSCGDCGHIGDFEEHKAHLKRRWHRWVKKLGMEDALRRLDEIEADSRRAINIFREGGNP